MNACYGDISGVQNTLLPVSREAFDTLLRLKQVCAGAQVSVSINANFDAVNNTLSGWYCRLPKTAPVSRIPIRPDIFDGITVVEAQASEEEILQLLFKRKETLAKLKAAAKKHNARDTNMRPSWNRCRPQSNIPLQKTNTWQYTINEKNLARYTAVNREENSIRITADAPLDFVPDESIPNYIDSAVWVPEISPGGWVGLYHQWYPLVNGNHELKMFFVCQSHCRLV
jgi:hypothetical protein